MLAPRYVLVCNDSKVPFIPCVDAAFETTSVQLDDYLKRPAAYAGLVYATSDLREAKRALAVARSRAEEWCCDARTIGICDAANYPAPYPAP
jgi:hypothetical protein